MNSSGKQAASAAEIAIAGDSENQKALPPGLSGDPVLAEPATSSSSITTPADLGGPRDLDPNDFDHEFDDDFEAEIPGEYELADDEYARALLDIVDFEIEGLEAYRDDDEDEEQDDQ